MTLQNSVVGELFFAILLVKKLFTEKYILINKLGVMLFAIKKYSLGV